MAWLAFSRKAFPAPLKPADNAVASAPRMLPASRYDCIQSMLSRARHSGAGASPEFMTTKHLTSKQNMTAVVISGTYPYGVATRCSNFNVASSPSSRIWTVCDAGARIDMLSRLPPACCAKDLAVLSREYDKLLLELSGRCSRVAVITPADQ